MQYLRLENGLTLISKCEPNLKNSIVNIFINIGSSSEQENKTGVAHFLEHMMFEGSKNYSNYDESLQAIYAENNAFTSQDYTNYYGVLPNENLNQLLKIEMDRMAFLSLNQKKFEIQKQVIIEEFKETSLNPPLADNWHYLLKMCFEGSYQWPVIGKNIKHIQDLDLKDIQNFYKMGYRPENTILSIISGIEESVIESIVSEIFIGNSESSTIERQMLRSKKKYGNIKLLKRKNVSTEHLFIAFHIADFGTKDYFIADLLSDVLSNGDSSFLYSELVTNLQVCTEITSYTTDNLRENLLVIEAKVHPDSSYNVVLDHIRVVLQKMTKVLTEVQLEKARNKALTHWAFQFYSPIQMAHYLALFYSIGIKNPKEFIEKEYCIELLKLKEFSKECFNMEQGNILVYTPNR